MVDTYHAKTKAMVDEWARIARKYGDKVKVEGKNLTYLDPAGDRLSDVAISRLAAKESGRSKGISSGMQKTRTKNPRVHSMYP
jgi:hypothetical protein